jgi:hypothetical protein
MKTSTIITIAMAVLVFFGTLPVMVNSAQARCVHWEGVLKCDGKQPVEDKVKSCYIIKQQIVCL